MIGSKNIDPITIKDHQSTTDSHITELNITRGGPLTNEFIIIVCTRNSQDVIERCLTSIKCQINDGDDVGIIFIDDSSTDHTYSIAESYINEHIIPQCNSITTVSNNIRKYLPRNLYNALTFLCKNPQSIIIQVDGDDLLEERIRVFDVLRQAYSDDTVITFGSHSRLIYGHIHRMTHDTIHDLTDVWNLDQCMFWDHLKTYRRFAFDLITIDMLQEVNSTSWIIRGEDAIIQPTIMDHYKDRVKFIDRPLYIHDMTRSNDHFNSDNIMNMYNDKVYNSFKIKSKMTCAWKTVITFTFDSYDDALNKLKDGHGHILDAAMNDYYALETKRINEVKRLRFREKMQKIRTELRNEKK